MFDVQGFILVGGASSRMGADKSQLMFGRQTAVERISAELRSVTSHVSLVGSRQDHAEPGLKNIRDLHECWGALGGLHAALDACRTEWAAILACDLPFVTGDLFLRLLLLAQRTRREVFDAIVPIQPDSRPQPLCALYRREPCLQVAERLIASGEHMPRALLATVKTRWVEFQELADLANADHFFLNVNTPADYERATQLLATG
jgi:molybdopterin-guanine dinucleotide biosynthesis protein A